MMNGLTIRVGSVDYTVNVVKGIGDKYNLFGQVVYGDTSVDIDAALSEQRQHNVLVHELVHAMMFEAGIEDQDEDLVNRLGHVLHGVLRDNDFGFIRDEGDVIEPSGEREESE